MPTHVYPCDDRLLIQPDPEEGEKVLASGIIIPAYHKQRPTTGTIIAVGNNTSEDNLVEGVRVLFGKYAGTDISIDNILYTICREADVLAIIEEEEDVPVPAVPEVRN